MYVYMYLFVYEKGQWISFDLSYILTLAVQKEKKIETWKIKAHRIQKCLRITINALFFSVFNILSYPEESSTSKK